MRKIAEYINLLVVIAIAVVSIIFGARLYRNYQGLLTEIKSRRQGIDERKEVINKIETLERQLEDKSARFFVGDIGSFRSYVERAVYSQGMRVVSSSNFNVVDRAGHTELKMTVRLTGKYVDFLRFIRRLEDIPGVYVSNLPLMNMDIDDPVVDIEIFAISKRK